MAEQKPQDDPLDVIEVEARARYECHRNHPTHRPLSDNYELVGLRGEQALSEFFGGDVDMVRRPNGDGGVDKVVYLATPYKSDVKTFRKPNNLIVEVGKVHPRTVYLLGAYDDDIDKAVLVGWEWGAKLLRAPTRDFGKGVINHYIPRGKLRSMTELLERKVEMPSSL